MDLGDPVQALRLSDGVDLDEFENQRRPASFLVKAAQAHSLRRDDAAAVLALLEAERYAPDMVRYSPKAREVVGVCLRREKSRTPALRRLAKRLDVTV